jgi:hypothetical protein
MKKIIILIFILSTITLQSCTTIKGYQRAYLNDKDMTLESRKIQRLEHYFHTYREGASGGRGGKSGGGCGCN